MNSWIRVDARTHNFVVRHRFLCILRQSLNAVVALAFDVTGSIEERVVIAVVKIVLSPILPLPLSTLWTQQTRMNCFFSKHDVTTYRAWLFEVRHDDRECGRLRVRNEPLPSSSFRSPSLRRWWVDPSRHRSATWNPTNQFQPSTFASSHRQWLTLKYTWTFQNQLPLLDSWASPVLPKWKRS